MLLASYGCDRDGPSYRILETKNSSYGLPWQRRQAGFRGPPMIGSPSRHGLFRTTYQMRLTTKITGLIDRRRELANLSKLLSNQRFSLIAVVGTWG